MIAKNPEYTLETPSYPTLYVFDLKIGRICLDKSMTMTYDQKLYFFSLYLDQITFYVP